MPSSGSHTTAARFFESSPRRRFLKNPPHEKDHRRNFGFRRAPATWHAAAAKVWLEIKDDQKTNRKAAKNDSEDQAATLGAEKARMDAEPKAGGSVGKYSLNAQQKIGAYSAAPGADKTLAVLHRIAAVVDQYKPSAHPPVGSQGPTYGSPFQRGNRI